MRAAVRPREELSPLTTVAAIMLLTVPGINDKSSRFDVHVIVIFPTEYHSGRVAEEVTSFGH